MSQSPTGSLMCLFQILSTLLASRILDTALAPGWLSPTSSRFWNSAAATAWLGFALAAFCAFYAVFASPSQDKLERSLRWVQFHVSHVSPVRYELLEGFPRNTYLLISWAFIRNSYTSGHHFCTTRRSNLVFPILDTMCTSGSGPTGFTKAFDPSFRCTASSLSGVGAFCRISPEPSSVHTCLLLVEFVFDLCGLFACFWINLLMYNIKWCLWP